MESKFLHNQNELKNLFRPCTSPESKYQKIIELGRSSEPYPEEHKKPENLVQGCQSIMYLYSWMHEGRVFYMAGSEALISAGLAALLIKVYSGEAPEVILQEKPSYLEELGIPASLTPTRSNGLYSLYLRMKQDALKFLVTSK